MFLKHPAWVWLKKHRKEILPAPSAALQARFDEGYLFEGFAEQLFGNITELGFSNFKEYLSLPARTKAALDAGAAVVTQGRIEASPITCIVDMLQRVGDNTFDLFEIKSSTGVKPEHIYDLAFQRTVLEDAGLSVRNVHVLYVNRNYLRSGAIDASALVAREEVTAKVDELMVQTRRHIDRALKTIESFEMPDPSPRYARLGSYQEWLEIYELLEGLTEPDSIYALPQASAKIIGQLEDAGIRTLAEISDPSILNATQQRFLIAWREGERRIDSGLITGFLDGLTYPLYFLDYETTQSVIPPFDGTRPYQQVPFQYSLHVQRGPGAAFEHFEFLHRETTPPVPALLDCLRADIGDTGSVLVWHQAFEKTRNTEMAAMVPADAAFLEQLNNRIVDLMEPFKQGWVIDREFGGSNSIKKVLPVLVPDLSYGALDVQEGETASRLWKQTFLEGKNAHSAEKVYQDLLEYCELDTWAMVRIFQVLKEMVKGPPASAASK